MTAIQDQTDLGHTETPDSHQERAGPSAAPTDLANLIQRFQAGVWRYVRYLGADTTEADDLTQETFLAVARGGFAERDERQTAGYLRTVARNQLLALRRKQNREISTVELEAADTVWAAAAGPDGSLQATSTPSASASTVWKAVPARRSTCTTNNKPAAKQSPRNSTCNPTA